MERVRRDTGQPDTRSAAASLLEGLLFPGFDPARGAESNRRYVTRKASIAIMEHRKEEHPERYPWTALGITERHYSKLARKFGSKAGGRYEDPEGVVSGQIRAYLERRGEQGDVRRLALQVLEARGFSAAAARKWLQRHPVEEAVDAAPRRRTP